MHSNRIFHYKPTILGILYGNTHVIHGSNCDFEAIPLGPRPPSVKWRTASLPSSHLAMEHAPSVNGFWVPSARYNWFNSIKLKPKTFMRILDDTGSGWLALVLPSTYWDPRGIRTVQHRNFLYPTISLRSGIAPGGFFCRRSWTSGCWFVGSESRLVGSARLDWNLHWLDQDGIDRNLADYPDRPDAVEPLGETLNNPKRNPQRNPTETR